METNNIILCVLLGVLIFAVIFMICRKPKGENYGIIKNILTGGNKEKDNLNCEMQMNNYNSNNSAYLNWASKNTGDICEILDNCPDLYDKLMEGNVPISFYNCIKYGRGVSALGYYNSRKELKEVREQLQKMMNEIKVAPSVIPPPPSAPSVIPPPPSAPSVIPPPPLAPSVIPPPPPIGIPSKPDIKPSKTLPLPKKPASDVGFDDVLNQIRTGGKLKPASERSISLPVSSKDVLFDEIKRGIALKKNVRCAIDQYLSKKNNNTCVSKPNCGSGKCRIFDENMEECIDNPNLTPFEKGACQRAKSLKREEEDDDFEEGYTYYRFVD